MYLFLEKVIEDGDVTYSLTKGGYALMFVLFVVAAMAISYFTNKDGKGQMSIKQISVSALCIALAFVMSNIKLFKLPMGGSVTLFSMFFITFIGYLYGPRVSISAAFAYGLLQMIVDPYIISVPQLVCDYVLAFTALGLAGFFYEKKNGMIIGYLVGIFGRFIFSVLSGVIFFAAYAPEGMHPVVYSSLYNGSYIGAEAVLTIIVLLIPAVHKALNRVKAEVNEKSIRKQVQLG
ncbi:energy-coupled thiamine transporter ThiT [Butyrivibrio sp. DSM 10294]|uniref:energy-coupled thiamine transporter ThiT n=1 Tax=Butyrivibrio sp. DSM 10294 TaxID=2972457 RepID=UPI00234EBA7F|nr:energy-coupled thiamine transporter ThiT [Butyrivibrio sp. DSM 10294]MDC7294357.1 energy-coupled thiamine transporter ThiT [Butyrivibrio sp. DSM 10294]